MKKGWTTTKLIAIGSLTVMEVLLEFIASTITLSTGMMFASGVLTAIVRPLFVINSLLIIDHFGTALIFMTISGVLTLPTVLSGPPGFLPKLPILIGLGLIQDSIFFIFKKRSKLITALLIGAIDNVYSAFVLIWVGRFFQVPGIDKAMTLFPLPIFIAALLLMGSIGGYFGYIVYQKIKDTAVVRRIQL